MSSPTPHLDRFLNGVHRRMTLLRVAERGGLAVLAGAVVALGWTGLAVWRGGSPGLAPALLLAVAVVSGLIWGLWRRPSRLKAAIEADRQLAWRDLLGSAAGVSSSGHDPAFSAVLLATADAACARARVGALKLHRLGARSWGGIGLAVAMVGAVYVLAGDPARSRAGSADPLAMAADSAPKSWQDIEDQRRAAEGATRNPSAPDLRRPRAGSGTDDDPLKSAIPDAAAPETATSDAGCQGSNTSAGAAPGAGAASGTTGSKTGSPETTPGVTGTGQKPPATTGAGAGTGGTASAESGVKTDRGGATGAATDGQTAAPPWRSKEWAAARAAARRALAGSAVPDAYRELVREYFERE